MILISEDEERNYRLSRRSFVQCLATIPVVGLQNYIRSYNFLFEPENLAYFSPYGVKNAPLRNARLANAIKHEGLLQDHRYTVFKIPPKSDLPTRTYRKSSKSDIFLLLWVTATWIFFAGLLVASRLIPRMTWVSTTTCAVFTSWSMLLRFIEYAHVQPAAVGKDTVTDSALPDAIFILGRNNSAFVLEGSRKDIKDWTSRGLIYRQDPLGIPCWAWHGFTRLGSLLVLLFVFSVIPNGSTGDQVVFILLNTMAQMNALVGQRLNGQCSLSRLAKLEDEREPTRTHVYAKLLRRFDDAGKDWVDAAGLLPKTTVWDTWRTRVVSEKSADPKVLYNEIARGTRGHSKKDSGLSVTASPV
jgi:hypothetical protein